MLKILSVTKSSDFQEISKKGQKFHAKTLLLLEKPTSEFYFQNKLIGKNADNFVRVGFTVSKTVGNAVVRNRAKRRLREAVREVIAQYAKRSHDYVVIAKKEISAAKFEDVLSDLKFCLKRIGVRK